ncbi:TonB-dependent receptor [Arsukibacterium sp.]|uniref:TonB-dependent receptor n=1 Tax=Arsukibacterium sp. TaxID=1977258 RepID=UPI002FDA30AB
MRRSPLLITLFFAVYASAEEDSRSLFDLGLEELMLIEVTVQRRVENIVYVPIATTVVRGNALSALNTAGEDMRTLSSRLPSLQVESSFGRTFPRFYLRGIGNTSFDIYASQPVSLLYDEVILESPILKGFPMFDLTQLEVARGPQGTLFGRNTPAGVVKLTSVQPTETFEGYARLGLGSYQTRNFEAAIAGALASGWSARLSVISQQRDDWVSNEFAGFETGLEAYRDSAMRLQLRYQGQDGFESLLKLHGRDLNGSAHLFRANIIEPGSNRFVAGFRSDRVAQDGRNVQRLEHYGASLRLVWPMSHFDLHAITAYETADIFSRGDIDGGFGASYAQPMGPGFIPFDSESAAALPRHGQFTQELRLASNSEGQFDWQAGLFWFDEGQKVENFNYSSTAGGVQNGYALVRQDNQALAAFASVGYAVNEHWQLRAGLRETRDRKQFSAERLQSPGSGDPLMPVSASSDASHLSWDLSALWRINEQHNAFMRVAEGFRAPSFQGRVMFSDTISQAHSETVLSIEAGIKAESADRRLRYAITLYSFQLDSPQLTAVGGSGNVAQLLNAKRASGQGAEVDFEAKLGRDWSLAGGLSYNHTAIRDSSLLVRVCSAPCTVVNPLVMVDGVRLARIDGNPLPYAPRWTGQLNLRYETAVASGMAYIQNNWTWRSGMNFFIYQSLEYRASSLLEGSLRLGYAWQNDRYDLALYARNLTDQTALIGGIDFNNLTGMINEPRVWGIELRSRF